jgi:hypothetical protein
MIQTRDYLLRSKSSLHLVSFLIQVSSNYSTCTWHFPSSQLFAPRSMQPRPCLQCLSQSHPTIPCPRSSGKNVETFFHTSTGGRMYGVLLLTEEKPRTSQQDWTVMTDPKLACIFAKGRKWTTLLLRSRRRNKEMWQEMQLRSELGSWYIAISEQRVWISDRMIRICRKHLVQ